MNEKLQAEKAAFCKDAEDYLQRLASTIEVAVSKVTIGIQECPVVDAILSTVDKSKIDLLIFEKCMSHLLNHLRRVPSKQACSRFCDVRVRAIALKTLVCNSLPL